MSKQKRLKYSRFSK